ncbi:MAG: hypothetical protein M3044_11360 [Thermoproteota archaeon]|nr:hypothetical protein [Thermoproteota archaeon]
MDRLGVFLDADNFNGGNLNHVVIIFPIYCRRVNPSSQDAGKIISKFEIHKLLLPRSLGTVMRHVEASKIEPTRPLRLEDYVTEWSGELATVVLRKDTMSILPDDHLEIEIRHAELGEIAKYTIDTDEILQSPYGVDVLLDAFHLFKANCTSRGYLTKTNIRHKDFKPQEVAASWLLTLLGFRSIHLAGVNKHDHYITNEPIHSVDVISSDSEVLLSIDCMTSIPDDKAVTQIYNAAKYISEKIDHSVVPIIISSENCSASKQSAKEKGVWIIDSQDNDHLFGLLVKGHTCSAKDLFYGTMS